MYTFFNIMLTENADTNLKLLNEKMNDGFSLDDRIQVGRSTLIVLRKLAYPENQDVQVGISPVTRSYVSETIQF